MFSSWEAAKILWSPKTGVGCDNRRITQFCGSEFGSNVSVLTVSITNRLRRLPVHGFLNRLLPSSVPKLTLCEAQTQKHLYFLGSSYWRRIILRREDGVYLRGWSEARTSRRWLHSGPLGSDSTRSPPRLLPLPSPHRELWSRAWTASLKTTTVFFICFLETVWTYLAL